MDEDHQRWIIAPAVVVEVDGGSSSSAFGWDRTRMDDIQGARIWCGHGVFAHNLVKISGLLEAEHSTAA